MFSHFLPRGYNIGVRLIEDFLARSNVGRCHDFRETADVIAKVIILGHLAMLKDVTGRHCLPLSISLREALSIPKVCLGSCLGHRSLPGGLGIAQIMEREEWLGSSAWMKAPLKWKPGLLDCVGAAV